MYNAFQPHLYPAPYPPMVWTTYSHALQGDAEVRVQTASKNHTNKNPKFMEYHLGDKDNHFLPVVLYSEKVSLGITTCGLRVELYT